MSSGGVGDGAGGRGKDDEGGVVPGVARVGGGGIEVVAGVACVDVCGGIGAAGAEGAAEDGN